METKLILLYDIYNVKLLCCIIYILKEMNNIYFCLFYFCSQIDNGTSWIEVKDNGYGISKEDAPYMGLSSYTSKILSFEDLGNIYTFYLHFY